MTSGLKKADAEETPDINYELKMVLIDRVELRKLRQQLAAFKAQKPTAWLYEDLSGNKRRALYEWPESVEKEKEDV